MAAYFNNSADRLYATLTTGLDRTKFKLMYCHGKWETGQGHNSANYLARLQSTSSYQLNLYTNATPVVLVNASGGIVNGTTTWSDNTWYGFGGLYEPDAAALSIKPYLDGSQDNSIGGSVDFSANAADFADLSVGQYSGGNNYSRWKGWIAELSVWECDTEATANSVVASLATTKATGVSVSGATCRGYWPLISDANADTYGANLTNSGSVTFDSEDPGLSGGSPPASTAQVIACII